MKSKRERRGHLATQRHRFFIQCTPPHYVIAYRVTAILLTLLIAFLPAPVTNALDGATMERFSANGI